MIKVSNFSSLWFGAWRNTFDQEADYVQKFAEGDNIVVQVTSDDVNNTSVEFRNIDTGVRLGGNYNIVENTYIFSPFKKIGRYEGYIANKNSGEEYGRCRFDILPDECLQGTVKLSYTHRRNDYDTIFIRKSGNLSIQVTFDIRFEGGFIFRDTEYAVEEETFRNQYYVQRLTSAFPYHKQVLTLGNGHGVPEWAGMKLNLIFSLSSVEVDGRKYVRSDGEVPERTDLLDYYPLYVWKLGVEPDDFYNTELQATDDGVPDGALTDNLGNLLTDNLGNYLTANN